MSDFCLHEGTVKWLVGLYILMKPKVAVILLRYPWMEEPFFTPQDAQLHFRFCLGCLGVFFPLSSCIPVKYLPLGK